MGVAGPAAMIANIFRAIRLHCLGQDTTSVVAHMYWVFPRWSVPMCGSKLALVLRRHDVVSAAPSFVVRMFCRFPFQSVRY